MTCLLHFDFSVLCQHIFLEKTLRQMLNVIVHKNENKNTSTRCAPAPLRVQGEKILVMRSNFKVSAFNLPLFRRLPRPSRLQFQRSFLNW